MPRLRPPGAQPILRALDPAPLTPEELAASARERAEAARQRGRPSPALERAARTWASVRQTPPPETDHDRREAHAMTHAQIIEDLAARLAEKIGRPLRVEERGDEHRARWRVAGVDGSTPFGTTYLRRVELIDHLRFGIAAAGHLGDDRAERLAAKAEEAFAILDDRDPEASIVEGAISAWSILDHALREWRGEPTPPSPLVEVVA